MLTLLASDALDKVLGPGVSVAPLAGGDVPSTLADVFGFWFNLFMVVVAIMVLFYMLWGAFEYVTSGGDAGKTGKAQQKMVNAAIGILLVIGAYSLWLVVVRDILGLFGGAGGSIKFTLPRLKK